MLPDLRIVIAAVISTFLFTVGVGFYTSSRLMNEPTKRTDSIAAVEETPVNRIALSWPEPTRQSEALELDFAVTARALRNPVRDVSNETPTAELQKESSVRASVIERIDSAHAGKRKAGHQNCRAISADPGFSD